MLERNDKTGFSDFFLAAAIASCVLGEEMMKQMKGMMGKKGRGMGGMFGGMGGMRFPF